ncbi:tetratricopeptide repeat protein [Desulfovibrio aminophilus]|nr:tetratricopeptide repeat protein [Desulfovibrio aminophilus]MCM0755681.1 tetratricopeptide repeat protein [Desulfovibrio aminophilus]
MNSSCPAILGVFTDERERKAGRGAASTREFTQRIHWLVLRLEEDQCLALPLNERGLPGEVRRPLSRAELLGGFEPAPHIFRDHLLSVLAGLRDKLEILGGPRALEHLSPDEAQALKALSIAREMDVQADDIQLARLLLAGLPAGVVEFGERAAHDLNGEGVGLRRDGQAARAVVFLSKALEMSPRDDHLHFNLARAYYDKKDEAGCRRCLEDALRLNPDLDPARRFLRFLDVGKAALHRGPLIVEGL